MDILRAASEPRLFAPWFRKPETWAPWFAFLAALFALPMTDEQAEAYRACTGRRELPTEPSNEAWLVCGRRAGKSFVLALVAVYLACFRDYTPFLAPGERGTILVIATDKKQARVILRYVRAMLNGIPMLKSKIAADRAGSIDLKEPVSIEIGTASFRSTRGYTLVAVLCDELAFWAGEDAAEPDYAVLDAVRPGMATIPTAMLLCASSPYARRGALWDAFKRWYGKDSAPLVWRAPTRTMNPTVSQTVIDRAYERDPENAEAEFGAEFRSDISQLLPREAVEKVVGDQSEIAPMRGVRYFAFVDPSGGRADSMTLAVAHAEGSVVVLDAVRERKPPFSPEDVVAEFVMLLKAYGLHEVTGDQYGGEWPPEQFRKLGISYRKAERSRSELYRELMPIINSCSIRLLDVPRLVNQLVNLERRTTRGGRDSIDHPPGGHDDIANAVAGVASIVGVRTKGRPAMFGTYGS